LCCSFSAWGEFYQARDWVQGGVFTSGIEGPAVDQSGQLYAVNFGRQGTIGLVDKQGKASLFISLPQGAIGNGIRFSAQGDMFIADYVGHNLWQLKAGSKQLTVFAHEPQMNQPNDLAMTEQGILFASDPNWSQSSGKLWRIDAQGKVSLLESNMGTTNGIEVSPDQQRLYVNESVQRKVWVYDLDAKGEISNKRLLIEFADHGLDGMRSDKQGNLFIARYGKGVVAMVSPQGKQLREIKLKGQHPTNVAFGGKAGKTVFVTMQKRGAIERFNTQIAGRLFKNKSF
jgi:sugar lactone lactonase YvrE